MTERTLATVARALEARVDQLGVFSGYASLFGIADSQGDVVERGAFRATLEAWRTQGRRPAMLWQHDPNAPVGLWTRLEEDAVGLRVEGRLLLSVQAGAEAHEHLKMGTVLGTCMDYVAGTGTLMVRRSAALGSGSYADWTVSVDGGAGPEGPAGSIGGTPLIATTTAATLAIQLGTTASFATAAELPLLPGAFVLMTATADPSKWMAGQIASRTGTAMTVEVQAINGSGNASSWTIQMVGPRGVQGPTGQAAPDASETVKGIAEIATQSETNSGTDDERMVTPLKLVTWIAARLQTLVNMTDAVLQRPELKDYAETVNAIGNTGTTCTIDLEAGNAITATLNGNCAFSFSNPPAAGRMGSFTLYLLNDGSGGRTTTWPSSVKWSGGSQPIRDTAANARNLYTFVTFDGGTTWFGSLGVRGAA